MYLVIAAIAIFIFCSTAYIKECLNAYNYIKNREGDLIVFYIIHFIFSLICIMIFTIELFDTPNNGLLFVGLVASITILNLVFRLDRKIG